MRICWLGARYAPGQIVIFPYYPSHIAAGDKLIHVNPPRQAGIALRAGRSVNPIFHTPKAGAGQPVMTTRVFRYINRDALFSLTLNIGAVTAHA